MSLKKCWIWDKDFCPSWTRGACLSGWLNIKNVRTCPVFLLSLRFNKINMTFFFFFFVLTALAKLVHLTHFNWSCIGEFSVNEWKGRWKTIGLSFCGAFPLITRPLPDYFHLIKESTSHNYTVCSLIDVKCYKIVNQLRRRYSVIYIYSCQHEGITPSDINFFKFWI